MATVLILILGCLSSCTSNSGTKDKEVENFVAPAPKQPTYDTKEEIISNLNGSVWTFTEPVNVFSNVLLESRWTRLEFKNGKVYIQRALPSDGSWGDPETKDYEVFDGRYSDTGEKYAAVKFGYYRFVPKSGVLAIPIEGSQIQLKQTDFNWD